MMDCKDWSSDFFKRHLRTYWQITLQYYDVEVYWRRNDTEGTSTHHLQSYYRLRFLAKWCNELEAKTSLRSYAAVSAPETYRVNNFGLDLRWLVFWWGPGWERHNGRQIDYRHARWADLLARTDYRTKHGQEGLEEAGACSQIGITD